MSDLSPLGFNPFTRFADAPPRSEWIITDRPLHRVLRFTRRTIDDVVNSPIVKNEVLGYYKLQKYIARRMEIVELEKQWNGIS